MCYVSSIQLEASQGICEAQTRAVAVISASEDRRGQRQSRRVRDERYEGYFQSDRRCLISEGGHASQAKVGIKASRRVIRDLILGAANAVGFGQNAVYNSYSATCCW
jgi:hypothetical protein